MQADGPLRARASTAYPQLNKAIENRFASHYKPAFTEMFRQAADAENEASSDPTLLGASFYDWVIEDSCETPHLSRWVVSISGKRYEYTGGAHGNTTFFNANFWIRNGRVEPVRLGQIFKPMYLRQERVEQLIRRELKAQKALWLKDVTRKELLGGAFTFSKKGLEFHYHPYTVGLYTQGSFRVLLPMAEIRHLIFPGGPMSRLAKAK